MTIPIHYPSLILGCNPGADFFGGWEKHVMKGTNVGMFFLWEKQRDDLEAVPDTFPSTFGDTIGFCIYFPHACHNI